MKKALVVDWLDKYAGSERVIKSLDKVFNFNRCHTLVNIMSDNDINKTFNNKDIKIVSTKLNLLGSKFRYFLFLFPYFIKQIKIEDDIDLIITSSHSIAKYVHSKNSLHISYFQARNMKYIWEEQDLYFNGIKIFFKLFIPSLQKFDLESSKNPDYIVANSYFVQKWVNKTYHRDSVVIYPPVDIEDFDLIDNKNDYYVAVGRIEPYKRFDIIIDTFKILKNKQLIVIGDGSRKNFLEKDLTNNITFTGFLEKNDVNGYVSKAKGFIFSGLEDFGIAPVEAQACGTPVICLGKGGTKETVIDGVTGVYFEEQTVDSLLEAIEKFEKNYDNFNPKKIREHSLKFSKERFEKEIKEFVDKKYELFKEDRSLLSPNKRVP